MEDDDPPNKSQTDQGGTSAEVETRGEVAKTLARVQEAVSDVQEGGLAESLEGGYRGDRFCGSRSAR